MQPESPLALVDPLPDDAILVHLGPHKTGTTSIQSTLAQSRAALAEHGVLYPGSKVAQHHEARALIQRRQGFRTDSKAPPPPALWTEFAGSVTSHAGRVVISSELFADADTDAAARLVRDLDPSRVHVVVGARNPAGIAMSSWQQVLKTFGRWEDFDTWLEDAFRRDGSGPSTNRFWQRVDTAALVSRWSEVVPLDRITVVALDEGDRRLLPATFEQLLGLPDGLLVTQQNRLSNRGLTAVELALIRGVNARLSGKLSWAEYSRLMRNGMLARLIANRRPGQAEGKVPLPAWALQQALAETDRNIAGLRATGVRVAGDLDSLRNVPAQAGPSEPITQVPLDLAVKAVVGAVRTAAEDRRKQEQRITELADAAAAAAAARKSAKKAQKNKRAKRTVEDASTRELVRAVLRRVLKRSSGR